MPIWIYPSPNYSDVHLHDTKQGYYILLLHNVCYDFSKSEMSIYVKDEKDVDLSAIPKGARNSSLSCSVSFWLGFPPSQAALSQSSHDDQESQQLHVDSSQCPKHCSLHGGLQYHLSRSAPAASLPSGDCRIL